VVVNSGQRTRGRVGHAGAAVALAVAVAGCGGAGGGGQGSGGGGESPSDVFRGEQMDFVVPFDPGGGYDVYTRTIAPYLEECLGARIVVKNEPGAGSLLATNQTAVSPPDGTRIQITNTPGMLGSQIAGAEGVSFDANEFSWIGRISSPPDVVLTNPDSDLTDFEAIANSTDNVQFVATGPGSSDYVAAAVLGEAYEIPHEIATGFAGSQEATNAVVAGEADVHVMPYDTVLPVIDAGDASPVAVLAEELPQYMPEAPLIGEVMPEGEAGQDLVNSLMTLTASGRAVTAPPGLPEDRLTALREGFACAMENEELLAELDEQQRPVNFLSGEEMQDLVTEVLAPTPEFQAVLEESF
jgi:tripartite-type tricarboxylate transporter receptor subunit TctC